MRDEGRFDPTIHAQHRLRICAMLNAAQQVEFSVVQDNIGVSASVLSKQVTTLTEAGYVTQQRAVRDSRTRVWLSLTKSGRAAYQAHIAALRAIVDQQSTADAHG